MKSFASKLVQGGIFTILLFAETITAQEENLLKAEIVTLSWKGKVSGLWFQTKEGPKSLDVYDRGFTAAESYVGSRRLAFHRDRSELALPPEKRPEPVAVAMLPEGGGEVLLIFVENSDKKSWQVQVIDNSEQNLPPGAYRVVNLTKESYTAVFDKSVTAINASGITIVRPAKQGEVRDLPVQIVNGKKLLYSSVWGHQEDRRGTVFLMPVEPGRSFLTIRRYFQPVLPTETAATP